jgi:putative NADH-flavin reductase
MEPTGAIDRDQAFLNVAIIGATGDTGRHFLELATASGHHVTALARVPAKLDAWDRTIDIRQADGRDRRSLIDALRGDFDAVVSIVGASGLMEARKVEDLYSRTTENLLAAMRANSLDRLIVVSSSGVEPQENDNWFYVNILKRFFLANMYEDMVRMENLLEQSGIRYTIARPPYLTKGAPSGHYRISKHRNFADDKTLRRGDLAHFLLRAVESPEEFSSMKVALSE